MRTIIDLSYFAKTASGFQYIELIRYFEGAKSLEFDIRRLMKNPKIETIIIRKYKVDN